MKNNKRSYSGMTKLCRKLGLVGKDGHYKTSTGTAIDLTATAETREAILYTIGRKVVLGF